MAEGPTSGDQSSPLFLDDYVHHLLNLANGELPDDPTVRDLLQELDAQRTELDHVEAGSKEVFYSGFMWESDKVTPDLSDSCLFTLAITSVLRTRHQLLYWKPMLKMGLEGRFKGHLVALEESRDMLRAVARTMASRPAAVKKVPRVQRRLALVLSELLDWLPSPDQELEEGGITSDGEETIDEVIEEAVTDPGQKAEPAPTAADSVTQPAAAPSPASTAPRSVGMNPLLRAQLILAAVLAVALVIAAVVKFS